MSFQKKPCILVVDDIPSNIEFVNDVLESEDIEVLGAKSGQEALASVRNRMPDLILLDISMPEMDGYEVSKVLKSDPKTAEIPIIFLTARVQKEDIIKGFEVGAVDYIIKPFNFNELISRVNTHIELKLKSEELKEVNTRLESLVEERTRQLKESNEELILANEKLTQANMELAKLDRAKNEFIAHINHELRTPLNGIIGYTSLLSEDAKDQIHKEYVDSITHLSQRLIRLSEVSLIFTELQANDLEVNLSTIDLEECLNGAIESTNLEDRGIELSSDFSGLSVKGEMKLLTTCFGIVLDNAVKYSPPKGTICINHSREDEFIAVNFNDNGPGFSEKAREKIFDLFAADNLEHRSYGFGIGLATAKNILDLFGGLIKIENQKPKGSCVSILIRKA